MERSDQFVPPARWTLASLGVQIIGALWIVAQAIYAVPVFAIVPLLPAILTAFAFAAQRKYRRITPTVLLALACVGEALIVAANRNVYWQSAVNVLAVPTPPGTLEPTVLLTISYWVWHLALPIVAIAFSVQLIRALDARKGVRAGTP